MNLCNLLEGSRKTVSPCVINVTFAIYIEKFLLNI
nr:MAG TPA: hypothetical protein [Bacteriophage sp.]